MTRITYQPWTEAEIYQLITGYRRRRTLAELAAKLDRSVDSINGQLDQLRAAGHIRRRGRLHSHDRWEHGHDMQLLAAIQDGLPMDRIATKLGRSEAACLTRLHELGQSSRQLRSGAIQVRSVVAVAALFGRTHGLVGRWLRDGDLMARRRKGGQGRHWLINDADLLAFLAYRPAWPDWDPAAMTDPDWRRQAQELRDAADGHWLTPAEVGAQLHADRNSVIRWTHDGRLPAMTRKRHIYIWSTDLAGFVVPADEYTGDRRSAAVAKAWERRTIPTTCTRCGGPRTAPRQSWCIACRRAYYAADQRRRRAQQQGAAA